MDTSLFELFKIGIGPSSSHTVGPMRAAADFLGRLGGDRPNVARVRTDLYGSLALTGIGHGTDRAVLAGLNGAMPDSITSAEMDAVLARAEKSEILLGGTQTIAFHRDADLVFHRDVMYPEGEGEKHPNGVRFTAMDASGNSLASHVYYSVGGGFIVRGEDFRPHDKSDDGDKSNDGDEPCGRAVPYPFCSAKELLEIAAKHTLTVSQLMMANEVALLQDESIVRPKVDGSLTGEAKVRAGILALWQTMVECADRGMATDGVLPGGLGVRRRAARLKTRLEENGSQDPLAPMDWLSVYAMAVNEENAAGGRVVTAPTNGAAGVIPAVGLYYRNLVSGSDEDGIVRYFLTAAAIGILYKENASISGAEVGCQGEVGVACSMAAGGIVASQNGTNAQIEHAAEIAMEHNLGMTCDPIAGLVQIPCIERNGMGAVKAVNASRMAMSDNGEHKVSLDQVIDTMYRTGMDMQSRYKETSLAGLALNIIEC